MADLWTVKADKIINGAVYCAGRVIELDEQCAEFLQAAGLEIEPGGQLEQAVEADLAVHVAEAAPVEYMRVRALQWMPFDGAIYPAGTLVLVEKSQAIKLIEGGLAQDGEEPFEAVEVEEAQVRVKILKRVLVDGSVRRPGTDLWMPESLALALVKEGKLMILVEESETATNENYERR